MPNILIDLDVDRVDLVDEGANSEAFIKLYKRREPVSMNLEEILKSLTPEQAAIINAEIAKGVEANNELNITKNKLATAETDLQTANNKVKELEKQCQGDAPDTEEVLKGLDPKAAQMFKEMQAQVEVSKALAQKAIDDAANKEAVTKAKELSAIPVEESKLVEVLKKADTGVLEILQAAAKVISENEAFVEKGKTTHTSEDVSKGNDAFNKIDAKATEIMKAKGITKAAAIAMVATENPELYKAYVGR